MNCKSGVNLKVESSFANLSSNSAVILSGRSTSTPKDSTQLSLNDLEPSFDSVKEKSNENLSFLNHIIDFAPIPIFGRRNLQLLNNCVNEGISVISKEAVGLLRNEENIDECLAKPNVIDKDSDKNNDCSKESSTGITQQLKQEIIKSKDKELRNSSNKISRICRLSGYKRPSYSTTKRRKSSQLESKIPVLTSSKLAKSPKLLTSIRAKLKQNREKLVKENEKTENGPRFSMLSDKKYLGRLSRCSQNTENILKQSKLSMPLMTTGNNIKKYQKEFNKNEQTEINKLIKLKEIKNNIKQKDDVMKLSSFKAQPIRKYSPLPKLKKRKITIPQSPKLGKRRYLNSYQR